MSYLLFMDESGHDHRTTPYEVRGGIVLHISKLWPFIQSLQHLELTTFGTLLHEFRTELKGCKLLDKDRFKWAQQGPQMTHDERRKHCRGFLTKGLEKRVPSRFEFTAYGQASLEMATGIFELLKQHDATVIASMIPKGAAKPETYEAEEFLRKDHVFLFERYFYMLERRREHGLVVMDEVEKAEDQRFVKRMEAYFRKTETGRFRSSYIVPNPLFVSSDMTYPIQAADLTMYCINWGFRIPSRGMDAEVRPEIADNYGRWLAQLQFEARIDRDGSEFTSYGIVYVPDPFASRT